MSREKPRRHEKNSAQKRKGRLFAAALATQDPRTAQYGLLTCVAFSALRLAHPERMAKAFLILCMSEALVASDALHVIMRQTLPATFAKHQPVSFSLLRPEAKTVNTGGHILGVCNVVVNQHATFRQWLAWDARTMSDFKLATVLPRCLHHLFPILRLGHCFNLCVSASALRARGAPHPE